MNEANRSVVPLPPLTLDRSQYEITNDVSASVNVKVVQALLIFKWAKIMGENKRVARLGYVNGYYSDDPSVKISLYRILEEHPEFDYVINIRTRKNYTLKNYFLFKVLNTETIVNCKGTILNQN